MTVASHETIHEGVCDLYKKRQKGQSAWLFSLSRRTVGDVDTARTCKINWTFGLRSRRDRDFFWEVGLRVCLGKIRRRRPAEEASHTSKQNQMSGRVQARPSKGDVAHHRAASNLWTHRAAIFSLSLTLVVGRS